MLKKVISMLFAILFIAGIVSVAPQKVHADTNGYEISYYIENTQKYEKVHMTILRNLDGGIYSHILGAKTNKGNVIYISKKQLSDKTEFILTPLKEGEFDFAMGWYHYNGSSTDMTLCGIMEFHVEAAKNEEGRICVSNLYTTFAKSGSWSTRSRSVDRYKYTEFYDMQITNQDNSIVYQRTKPLIDSSTVLNMAKHYYLEEYYLVNGKHLHYYGSDGVCTKCGLKRYDYLNGFQTLFYKTEAPEQGTLYSSVRPVINGKTYNIPVDVYVPYGYSPKKGPYDVVFLVTGSGGTITNWTSDVMDMYLPGGSSLGKMYGKKLFDWLIYTRQSKPFIAVSIPMQPYNGSYSNAYSRYANFIVNYWLPMIVDGYGICKDYTVHFGGTYAKSSKEADIVSAKDHFMIAGLSQGSIFIANCAVDSTTALGKRFGIKVLMSAYTHAADLDKKFGKNGYSSGYKMYYVSGGPTDKSGGGSPYDIMNEYVKKNSNGTYKYPNIGQFKLFMFDSGHKWYTWFRGFATVMQEAMK